MALQTVTALITDQFISALCNTLVHSLWQGVLLAVVTGLIIMLTRKASAATRYNLLIASLVVFAVGVGITFATQLNTGQSGATALQNIASQPMAVVTTDVQAIDLNIGGNVFENVVKSYLNNHHNTIVLIWFLIICAKSIQLGFGLWGIGRMKRSQVSINAYWANRVQQMADSLAIKQSVALFESALAKVPMVIGNLKPVILMPIGLLTALSTEEVEAILVHELAHIKRRDYLVNLLQSLMEIVFFFNPAVLWVSQLIKTERENCCDDLALAQNSNKVNYIRALVSCEEYQAAVPAYAMALPGSKNTLMSRVKRIAGNRNHSLNLFEKTALAVCLVVSGVCFTAFTGKEHIEAVADKIAAVIEEIQHQEKTPKDTDDELATVAKEDKVNAVNSIQKKDAPVTADKMDSLDLVATDLSLSGTQDMSFNNTSHLNLLSACLPPLGVQLAALTKNKTKVVADSATHLYKYDKGNNQWIDYKQTEAYAKKRKADTTKKVKANTVVLNNLSIDARVNFQTTTSFKTDTRIDYKADSSGRYLNLYKNGKGLSLMKNYVPDTTKHLAALSNIKINLHMPSMANLLNDAGIIKDKANFSAFLNNNTLIVDGEVQPENVHQQILKKFQKKPDDPVNLSFTYGNPPGRIVPVK